MELGWKNIIKQTFQGGSKPPPIVLCAPSNAIISLAVLANGPDLIAFRLVLSFTSALSRRIAVVIMHRARCPLQRQLIRLKLSRIIVFVFGVCDDDPDTSTRVRRPLCTSSNPSRTRPSETMRVRRRRNVGVTIPPPGCIRKRTR